MFFFFGGEGGVFVCVHQEMLISFFSFLSSLAMQTEKKKKAASGTGEKQFASKTNKKGYPSQQLNSYGQQMNGYYMYKYDHPRRKMSKSRDGAQQPQYDGGGAGGGDGDGVNSTRDDGDGGDLSSTGDGGGGSSTAGDDGDRDDGDGDGEGGRNNCRCCCTLQSSFGSAPSKCPSPALSMLCADPVGPPESLLEPWAFGSIASDGVEPILEPFPTGLELESAGHSKCTQ